MTLVVIEIATLIRLDYRSSSNAACDKKRNRVNLLRRWKEDQKFLEILRLGTLLMAQV